MIRIPITAAGIRTFENIKSFRSARQCTGVPMMQVDLQRVAQADLLLAARAARRNWLRRQGG
jgi:hypothetical protein